MTDVYMLSILGISLVIVNYVVLSEMKQDLESEGRGPERNSADYRIKKAQVLNNTLCINGHPSIV